MAAKLIATLRYTQQIIKKKKYENETQDTICDLTVVLLK